MMITDRILTNYFERILHKYGLNLTWRQRIEGERDDRGHPTVTYKDDRIRALFHRNTGSEHLVLGQQVKNYDAFMLVSKNSTIKDGDEIIAENIRFRIAEVIENRSHLECHLKKVEA